MHLIRFVLIKLKIFHFKKFNFIILVIFKVKLLREFRRGKKKEDEKKKKRKKKEEKKKEEEKKAIEKRQKKKREQKENNVVWEEIRQNSVCDL